MLIKPNWNKFKSKFHSNPQEFFEWFAYLLFCREFGLEKGWFGFQNQSAIEKEPLIVGNEVIAFQAKFYESSLTDHKDDFTGMLDNIKRDYSSVTKILIYTNEIWGQAWNRTEKKMLPPKAYQDIQQKADDLNIQIEWRDNSFFESEFVALTNSDLARYFFDESPFLGWKRFEDWSNKPLGVDSEYFFDERIKIFTPNHNRDDAKNLIDGLNEIRSILSVPNHSVRLVGLSGVGKTRFAQALFDNRIGDKNKSLDPKIVWYCDYGNSPDPLPEHFIERLIEEDKKAIVIVDNCGQDLHSRITKLIKNAGKISLLTIEYDVRFDSPENTDVYKLECTTIEILEKVLKRDFPYIEDINRTKIAEFSGGNYRLALAIATNIDKSDNLAVLTDEQLFSRLFYQQGVIDQELFNVAKMFSLVFSFNVEDIGESESEIKLLAELTEITPRKAYQFITTLLQRDIVQKRGDFRAILPHAIANKLALQGLSSLPIKEIQSFYESAPERLKLSFIKRLSYLHNDENVKSLVKDWLSPKGFLGDSIIHDEVNEDILVKISLLAFIFPVEILDLIELRYQNDSEFLSINNSCYEQLTRLLSELAYYKQNFERAFKLLFEIYKSEGATTSKGGLAQESVTMLFHYFLSRNEATCLTRKKVLSDIASDSDNYPYLLEILRTALDFNGKIICLSPHETNGSKQTYGYQPKTYGEIWEWFDFVLNQLYILDEFYPTECRKIFCGNIKEIIWTCRKADIVFNYIKLFNERQYFDSALLAVQRILKYEEENLKEAPQAVCDLKAIRDYLIPDKTDISRLIKAYVLRTSIWDYKSNFFKDINAIEVCNFSTYEELIDYICNNLDEQIVSELLPELLSSSNSEIRKIGFNTLESYQSKEKLTNDLLNVELKSAVYVNSFFISGLFKKVIELDFEFYKSLANSLIVKEEYKLAVICSICEVSLTHQHYEFILNIIKNFPETAFLNLSNDLAFKKYHNQISDDLFESILIDLEELGQGTIVAETLRQYCQFKENVDESLIPKLVSYLPSIIETHKNWYEYNKVIELLLEKSEETQDLIFELITKAKESQKYFSLIGENPFYAILTSMIKFDNIKVMNFIYEDKISRLFSSKGLSPILGEASEDEILSWVGNEQLKIDFLFKNFKFYKQLENKDIEWNQLLISLLSLSSSPQDNLTMMLKNQITRITGWMNSLASTMEHRLVILESLKQFLQINQMLELTNLVEQKIIFYKADIQAQYEIEKEEDENNKRFEW